MQKRITIDLDERIYYDLCQVIGKHKIGQYIEALLKSHVIYRDLDEAYKAMGEDQNREKLALEWADGTIGDVANESW